MTPTDLPLPVAAARLGVKLRVLRDAIRARRLPAPAHNAATGWVTQDWLAHAEAAEAAAPGTVLATAHRQKTPAFARFQGTSAWVKHPRKRTEYARFRATAANAAPVHP